MTGPYKLQSDVAEAASDIVEAISELPKRIYEGVAALKTHRLVVTRGEVDIRFECHSHTNSDGDFYGRTDIVLSTDYWRYHYVWTGSACAWGEMAQNLASHLELADDDTEIKKLAREDFLKNWMYLKVKGLQAIFEDALAEAGG